MIRAFLSVGIGLLLACCLSAPVQAQSVDDLVEILIRPQPQMLCICTAPPFVVTDGSDPQVVATQMSNREHATIVITTAAETGSADLTDGTKTALDLLGKALNDSRLVDFRFLVAATTDARGSESRNDRLSRERAFAALDYLVASSAVDRDRLVAIGLGERTLALPNEPNSWGNRKLKIVRLD